MSERYNPVLAQVRECRSLLLDFLNSVWGSPHKTSMVEEELLDVMLALDSPVDADYVRRDLAYLQARGLIEPVIEEHPVRKVRTRRWRLTARGVTFIERGKPWSEIEVL